MKRIIWLCYIVLFFAPVSLVFSQVQVGGESLRSRYVFSDASEMGIFLHELHLARPVYETPARGEFESNSGYQNRVRAAEANYRRAREEYENAIPGIELWLMQPATAGRFNIDQMVFSSISTSVRLPPSGSTNFILRFPHNDSFVQRTVLPLYRNTDFEISWATRHDGSTFNTFCEIQLSEFYAISVDWARRIRQLSDGESLTLRTVFTLHELVTDDPTGRGGFASVDIVGVGLLHRREPVTLFEASRVAGDMWSMHYEE